MMAGWDFFSHDCNRGGLVSMLFSVITFLTQRNIPFYVCLKSIALCNYRSRCCSSAALVQNIGKFGAKKHFTDHRAVKIYHFRTTSFAVMKSIWIFDMFLDFLINDEQFSLHCHSICSSRDNLTQPPWRVRKRTVSNKLFKKLFLGRFPLINYFYHLIEISYDF